MTTTTLDLPKLDLDDVRMRMKRLADENPDRVYEAPVSGSGCLYVHSDFDDEGELVDQKPGCIVGHLLADIGVPLSVLADNEFTYADSLVTRLGLVDDYDAPVARYLGVIQSRQDNDVPWGEAVNTGEVELSRILEAQNA